MPILQIMKTIMFWCVPGTGRCCSSEIFAHPMPYRHLTPLNGMYGACPIIHNSLQKHDQAIAPARKFWPTQCLRPLLQLGNCGPPNSLQAPHQAQWHVGGHVPSSYIISLVLSACGRPVHPSVPSSISSSIHPSSSSRKKKMEEEEDEWRQ